MILSVPIFKHIIIRLWCAQILGHLKIINLTLGTNGKFIALCVPILKHITVTMAEIFKFFRVTCTGKLRIISVVDFH